MKKSFIVSMIIAFAVMVGGMIVCIVAQNEADRDRIDLFTSEYNNDGELINEYAIDLEKYTKISLALPDADVEIIGNAKESKLELVNFHAKTYSLNTRNGIFEFDDSFDISSLLNMPKNDFSFKGIRSLIDIIKGINDRKKIRLYLSGDKTVSFSLELQNGDFKINGVDELSDIYVAIDSGNADMCNISASSSTVKIINGNINADHFKVKKSIFTIHDGDCKYITDEFQFHNIKAETENGNIKVLNNSQSSPFTVKNPLAYIDLSISCLNGNININE